ncbi:MAG: EAL domain-containing protein [Thiolinea sp.]
MSSWLEHLPNLIVSINVSPFQLRNADFIQRLKQLLPSTRKHDCLNLEFELTETASITNSRHIAQVLQAVSHLGIQLSLDDFGQGNTSFLELKQGLFSVIKIDKSLLWEALKTDGDRQLLQATIQSAHSLGLQITAEGIETEQHLQLAKELACNKVQGFMLSPPLSAAEFGALLQQQRPAMAHVE